MNMAHANGALAAKQPLSLAGMLWFKNQVRNGGPWDYKQINSGYQNFGNYNYGYAGTAQGIGGGVLLRQAGNAQIAAGTSRPEWGEPGTLGFGGVAPFGDDPLDQMYISQGISDRSDGC
jgi:type VI secretion system secreted protein VgrG